MAYYPLKDEEAQYLADPILKPVPLRIGHLWKAAKTYDDAFEFDPLIMYYRAGCKPSRAARRAQGMLVLGLWSIKDIALTINGGSALMIAFPNFFGKKTSLESFIDSLAVNILEASNRTEEQKKRSQEGGEKARAVLDATIRDRLPDMIYLGLACTKPASQGHGYGGAFIEAVNDIADERGKAMWLTSSNVLNDVFYNSHGFHTIGTFYMGERNPEWNQKPIPVQIMVREPKTKCENQPPTRGPSKALDIDPMFPLQFLA